MIRDVYTLFRGRIQVRDVPSLATVLGLGRYDICVPEAFKLFQTNLPRSVSKNFKKNSNFDLNYAQQSYSSAEFFPIIPIYGLHWTKPCQPSLIGYWLLEECNLNSQMESGANLEKAYVNLICNCILKDIYQNAKLYRNIQLLSLLLNGSLSGALLAVITNGILMLAMSLVAVVKLEWNWDNSAALGACGILLGNTVATLMVLLGGLVGVYSKSEEVFRDLKTVMIHKKRENGFDDF
ncbi:hypothetical protein Ocin01_16032 [Orchesella cincta]|uniref:Uncharacterized protein n=1 Tax=Orchesella cincta TaxID=48709 RepID=A0A1D2MCL1_ORCCI|nr:hypothetical protein Ocin01_16032 [Orchesella cincta]